RGGRRGEVRRRPRGAKVYYGRFRAPRRTLRKQVMAEQESKQAPATQFPDIPWLPPEHFENQRNFPLEERAKYAGLYIAWNWEGDRILDSASDREVLWDQLVAAGINPHRVVFAYVDDM